MMVLFRAVVLEKQEYEDVGRKEGQVTCAESGKTFKADGGCLPRYIGTVRNTSPCLISHTFFLLVMSYNMRIVTPKIPYNRALLCLRNI